MQALLDNGASDVLFDMNSRYDRAGIRLPTGLRRNGAGRIVDEQGLPVAQPLYARPPLFVAVQRTGGLSQAPGSVGYKEVVIDPQVVGDIRSARVAFESPYGLIRSEWNDTPQTFRQTVEIPGNASALVYLPTADPEAISENGQPLDKIEGITVERKGDRTVLHVGSGVYNFSVRK